jgi:hypothetical protein
MPTRPKQVTALAQSWSGARRRSTNSVLRGRGFRRHNLSVSCRGTELRQRGVLLAPNTQSSRRDNRLSVPELEVGESKKCHIVDADGSSLFSYIFRYSRRQVTAECHDVLARRRLHSGATGSLQICPFDCSKHKVQLLARLSDHVSCNLIVLTLLRNWRHEAVSGCQSDR